MKTYAVSDIHGCYHELMRTLDEIDLSGDNRLIVLGDMIGGGCASWQTINYLRGLQQRYADQKIILLRGNHEQDLIDRCRKRKLSCQNRELTAWLSRLPLYYETETHIYVHAGICEEAGELWRVGTPDHVFLYKYPPQMGWFYKTIVAGHVGTGDKHLSGDPGYIGVWHDGMSHYYIDGNVLRTGRIPVYVTEG